MMKKSRGNSGFTLVELMVGILISFIVVLGFGNLILANQKAMAWSTSKATLQQDFTQTMEWMSRSLRQAFSVKVINAEEFQTYDGTGSLTHTYWRSSSGDLSYLMKDDSRLSQWNCSQFGIICNADTTSLTLNLELTDNAGNSVTAMTRTTLRNQAD
jgi:prepilin-type N-terminal cleavage/methylation domain-containing protein